MNEYVPFFQSWITWNAKDVHKECSLRLKEKNLPDDLVEVELDSDGDLLTCWGDERLWVCIYSWMFGTTLGLPENAVVTFAKASSDGSIFLRYVCFCGSGENEDDKLVTDINDKWNEAERTGEPVSIGHTVVCDHCNVDYTDRPDTGGLIFSSSAYCPECAPGLLRSAMRYSEERFIRATCPPGKSFAQFVIDEAGGPENRNIHISKG